jgi:hypothetical protein
MNGTCVLGGGCKCPLPDDWRSCINWRNAEGKCSPVPITSGRRVVEDGIVIEGPEAPE